MSVYDFERLPRGAALDFTEIQAAVEAPKPTQRLQPPERSRPSQSDIVEIRLADDPITRRIVDVMNAAHIDPHRFQNALRPVDSGAARVYDIINREGQLRDLIDPPVQRELRRLARLTSTLS